MSVMPVSRRSLVFSLLLLRSCPHTWKPWAYNLARLAVIGLYLYVASVAVLMAAEDRIVYNAVSATVRWREPPPGLNPQDVEFTTADGIRLHGWWCPPANWTPEQGALLSCHGKGGNLTLVAGDFTAWRKTLNVSVLLFDYPGYGKSGGQPSEAGCYAAADAAYDWLVNVQHVPPERVLIHGQSLGGGVAVDLAVRRPQRALILTSTFTSFPDAAQAKVLIFPAKWLTHNQFRNVDKIGRLKTPVFIAHGTADDWIPYEQGERLFAAVTSPQKRFLRVDGGPHNLLHGGIERAIRDFLNEAEVNKEPGSPPEGIMN
jgi:fermentation-respiration switch protein FrsA (DUF1100 family)